MTKQQLTDAELNELGSLFSDLFDFADMDRSIDPLTWRSPENDTSMHYAAARGEKRALELLLKAGVDVDVRGEMNSTPLHYAAMFRHRSVFDWLLQHGADASLEDDFGVAAGAFPRPKSQGQAVENRNLPCDYKLSGSYSDPTKDFLVELWKGPRL